jgi:L-threonylcarbamoyladenylate synthase
MVRLRVDSKDPSAAVLEQAAAVIRLGGIVAYPTDTFYGLAADPRRAEALSRLREVKGRPAGQPVPLIAADLKQVADWVGVMTPLGSRLAARFWPGPLTLVIEGASGLCPEVLAEGRRVAVRVPADPVACGLAAATGHAITSTSANRSGEPPAATADEVESALGTAIDLLLDAGAAPGGMPSTLVDVTGPSPVLVRPGAVPWDRVLESAG